MSKALIRRLPPGFHARPVRRLGVSGAIRSSEFHPSYNGLEGDYAHKVIDHAVQYVGGQIHTNSLESNWSLLKRGISGTYISVEPFHLFRYLDEQTFRYNHRKGLNDGDRLDIAVRQIVGKRLEYKKLIGQPSH